MICVFFGKLKRGYGRWLQFWTALTIIMPLSRWFSYMWFDTWEDFGPRSSVARITCNYGFCFSVLVVALEVLCASVGRSSDGYLNISICGLNKFDSGWVLKVCESDWCSSYL